MLVIHTKNNGEISEAASGKNKEELEAPAQASNEIDSWDSPYKAIVSVLMLKEGWDVRNVTAIVGLRAYAAKSNILPEQTLGRGLRRMYFGIDHAGNRFRHGHAGLHGLRRIHPERRRRPSSTCPMGAGAQRKDSLVVEVDAENEDKDLDALDIALPRALAPLPARIQGSRCPRSRRVRQ